MDLHNGNNRNEDWINRWSRNVAIAVQRAWPPTRDWIDRWYWKTVIAARRWWRRPMSLTKWGQILLSVGLFIACYFLFVYDTTVADNEKFDTPFGRFGGGRFHNLGLQQNRMLGSIAGMIMAAVGAIMVVIDKKIPGASD